MLRKLGILTPFSMGGGLMPIVDQRPDFDHVPENSEHAKSIFAKDPNETGKDRLYMMFSTDEFGSVSPEVTSIVQSGFLGAFTGVCIGGFLHSRNAYLSFMERNEATSFTSHFDAKKALQDQVTINFAKGAFRWGWRLGLFTSSYVMITTSIAVYRGKSSILEYAVAGGLSGAVYKANLGLRGIAVGGALGGVLGGFAGAISLALLKATGMSMEEVRYWQYRWKDIRDKSERSAYKNHRDENENPMLLEKDKKFPNQISLTSIPEDKS